MSEVSGMTVNERLYAKGLLPEWDEAIRCRDREKLVELARLIELKGESQAIVEAALTQPGLAK